MNNHERILVVDDSPETLELVQRNLAPEGYEIVTAAGVEEALDVLRDLPLDLVITDMKMPRVSGLDLIRHIRENFRNTEVIMITGYASIEGAVTAVKLGAEEYLAKPFTRAELLAAVGRAMDALRVRRAALERSLPPVSYGLVGESEAMRRIYAVIARGREDGPPVLILGENGTGRESVARAIHYHGRRAGFPFVSVNCAAIPSERGEVEVFGRELPGSRSCGRTAAAKGSGGAADPKHEGAAAWPGFLNLAGAGSVFLRAAEELPLSLQERLVVRLAQEHPSVPRVLAASSATLPDLVERGVFSRELYDILGANRIDLPPLRKRGDDILLLARHFAARAARSLGRSPCRFSDRALQVLRDYHWPGNLLELENVIGHLSAAAESGLIEVPDLPSLMRFSALRGSGAHRSLAEVEIAHIRGVLSSVAGNKTKAADILGIDRKTLREKLRTAEDGTDAAGSV